MKYTDVKGREWKCVVKPSSEDLKNLPDKHVKTILDNCNTKILLKDKRIAPK